MERTDSLRVVSRVDTTDSLRSHLSVFLLPYLPLFLFVISFVLHFLSAISFFLQFLSFYLSFFLSFAPFFLSFCHIFLSAISFFLQFLSFFLSAISYFMQFLSCLSLSLFLSFFFGYLHMSRTKQCFSNAKRVKLQLPP